MRTFMRWLAGPAMALACGCSPDCSSTKCTSEISVGWATADLPPAARTQVCVDDACADVRVMQNGSLSSVSAGGGGRTVRVRLVLMSQEGATLAELSGQGRKMKSSCCQSISFRAHDGVLDVLT